MRLENSKTPFVRACDWITGYEEVSFAGNRTHYRADQARNEHRNFEAFALICSTYGSTALNGRGITGWCNPPQANSVGLCWSPVFAIPLEGPKKAQENLTKRGTPQ